MTETKHKEHITSEHFGIPADFADRVANYAAWRVQALSEQLAEAQALIEASRNEALELAATVCDKANGPEYPADLAIKIRALK